MGPIGNDRASRIWKGEACVKIWAPFVRAHIFFGMGVWEYGGMEVKP